MKIHVMEKGQKFQVSIVIMGGWIVILGWARSVLSSPDPLNVGPGRIKFVVALYLVVFLYASWKMFKPNSWSLSEFKETDLVQELPDIPVDTSDPTSFIHWSPTVENLDDYAEKVEEFKKKKD